MMLISSLSLWCGWCGGVFATYIDTSRLLLSQGQGGGEGRVDCGWLRRMARSKVASGLHEKLREEEGKGGRGREGGKSDEGENRRARKSGRGRQEVQWKNESNN